MKSSIKMAWTWKGTCWNMKKNINNQKSYARLCLGMIKLSVKYLSSVTTGVVLINKSVKGRRQDSDPYMSATQKILPDFHLKKNKKTVNN